MGKKIQFLIVASFLALTLTLSQSAYAQTKPGWGFGDDNHTHVGPPGQSDRFDNEGDDKQGNDDNGNRDGNKDNKNNHKSEDAAINQFMLHWFNLFAAAEKDFFSHLHEG